MFGVLAFGIVWVWVVRVLPRGVRYGFRGCAGVFMCVVGLDRAENSLGVGGDLVCGRVTDGGEAGLVFGTGLEPRCCF